jgi:hypothetical protein
MLQDHTAGTFNVNALIYVVSRVSGGQGSWLQMQRSGFDSRRYQIFWEVVGLERGSASWVKLGRYSEEIVEAPV